MTSDKLTIVGITGFARSGKDTFFSLLSKRNSRYKRYAFADKLKQDLRLFLMEQCHIDINTIPNEKKHLVRPMMIAYGCLQRDLGDGLHWVREMEKQMLSDIRFADMLSPSAPIPVITDIRFPNEAKYLKEKYNLILVEVNREGAPTPPDEELKNQPLVREYVDHFINWPTVGDDKIMELQSYVDDFAKLRNLP